MIRLALALAATSLFVASCMSDHACTLIGCPGGALLQADVPASWDRLQRPTITTCHDDTCRFVTIDRRAP